MLVLLSKPPEKRMQDLFSYVFHFLKSEIDGNDHKPSLSSVSVEPVILTDDSIKPDMIIIVSFKRQNRKVCAQCRI